MTVFAPNVTRTLGGPPGGWTGKLFIQSVTATGATVEWRRFSDGQLILTQTLQIPSGTAVRVDPREIAGLTDSMQYSVRIAGTGGTVVVIVGQSETFGDESFYEAFPE